MSGTLASARHSIWLFAAALASLGGSAALLGMARSAEGVSAEVGGGPAALGLGSLVVLLALSGLTLAAMATRELIVLRRQSHLG